MLTLSKVVNLTEEFALQLDANRTFYNCHLGEDLPAWRHCGGLTIVQKIRPVPTPSLIFGCARNQLQLFYDRYREDLLACVENIEALWRTLADNTANIMILIKSVPRRSRLMCLAHNFQVFLDAHDRVHHMDLDQCFVWGIELDGARPCGAKQNRVRGEQLNRTVSCLK